MGDSLEEIGNVSDWRDDEYDAEQDEHLERMTVRDYEHGLPKSRLGRHARRHARHGGQLAGGSRQRQQRSRSCAKPTRRCTQ